VSFLPRSSHTAKPRHCTPEPLSPLATVKVTPDLLNANQGWPRPKTPRHPAQRNLLRACGHRRIHATQQISLAGRFRHHQHDRGARGYRVRPLHIQGGLQRPVLLEVVNLPWGYTILIVVCGKPYVELNVFRSA